MGKTIGIGIAKSSKEVTVQLVLENMQSIAAACQNLGVLQNTMEHWLVAKADSYDLRIWGNKKSCHCSKQWQELKN